MSILNTYNSISVRGFSGSRPSPFSGGTFTALAYDNTASIATYTRNGGNTWSNVTVPAFNYTSSVYDSISVSVAAANLVGLGSGSNGGAQSTTGYTTWTTRTFASIVIDWQSMAEGNGITMAVGNTRRITRTDASGVVANGFFPSGNLLPTLENWKALTWGNGTWVAVAKNPTTTTAATSTDPQGNSWTARTMTAGPWNSVAYGSNTFVAVAENGNVATSPDGVTWTDQTAVSANFTSLVYGNNLFVATAANTTSVFTSSNGATWTTRSNVLPVSSNGGWYITYGGNLFMAVGANTNSGSWSIDGTNWTSTTLSANLNWSTIVFTPL